MGKMGSLALEEGASSAKMSSKLGRQKGSGQDVKNAVMSMKKMQLYSYLKSHHLLRNCNKSKADQLPKPGDMVWARNYGSVYWPAFVAQMVDRDDIVVNGADEIDDTAYTFVMFLEETFRFAPIPWEQIIPFQDYEAQKFLVPKFNKVVVKQSWKPSTGYKKALELIDEFFKLPPLERQNAAIGRFEIKKEGQAKKKEKEIHVPKETTEGSGKPPVAEEISKVVSQTKVKKKSGLRVSDRIVGKRIGKLKSQSKQTAKKKTEKPAKEEKTPKKPNKKARPDVGGEILKQWTKDRFDGISKQFVFDTTKPALCRECNVQFAENEDVKTCHGMPYHERCLTATTTTDNESTALKCSNCINQLCFLCKIPSEEAKVAFKCCRCDLRFHIDCLLSEWPQAEIQGSNGPITCPLHFCHTCLGEQRTYGKCRDFTVNPSKAFKCSLCLSTYHKMCLPAGCGEDIQGKEYIVCPRHKIPELKMKRRIGCMTCSKALKPKEDRVECQLCIQAFHPACVGYTGEVSETVSLEIFGKNYKCFTCQWGLFPLYGQVVWYQQPQSQFWPARILYPNESKRRVNGIKRFPGQYSVEYFGHSLFYDNASRTIPLLLTTIDVFKVMKVYHDTPKILRAHEEAAFFLQFAEVFRDSNLPKAKPVYKKIERNVYRTVVAQKVKEPSDVCSCSEDKSESVCLADSGCTNRDMEMECSDRICKGKSRCKNRMFTERKNDEDFLEQKPFQSKGWGVVAKQRFNPGDFVSEYRGEVIDRNEMLWRLSKKEEEDPMYILEISKEFFIDAEYVGNLSRLINHSCNPNCEVRKYLSQGRSVGGIFAKRHIELGEEITFDYDCGSQSTAPFRCRCGTNSCLVFVGKEIPDDFQADDENDMNVAGRWEDQCKCGFGGRLICCEYPGCRKVWHYSCAKLSRPPTKSWCCPDHPDTTKFRKKMSSVTRTKTTANVKSTKIKNIKTEPVEVSSKTPVPKKRSHKAVSQASTPSPPSSKANDKVATSSVPRKRKSNISPSKPCSSSKKLKTMDTPSETITTPPVTLAVSSSRRSLRSSKASDTRSSTSEKQEISTPTTSELSNDMKLISTKDAFVQVNGDHQPEEIEKRKSSVTSQITTPITRSTRKRKVNGICDDLCEAQVAVGKEEDEPTANVSLPEVTVPPEISLDKLTKIEADVTMTTPTNNRRRSANRASRNSKLSEPFSPLALNSNLPPRDGRRRSSMVHIREPLVPSDKNMRVGMKTRSSSNGSYQESQVYGENSRRSSTTSIPNHRVQAVSVTLTDIKHEVPNGYSDSVPLLSEQQQRYSMDLTSPPLKRHVNA